MRIRILGKFWALRLVPTLGSADSPKRGDCDSPGSANKSVRILSGLRGEERLEVLIHEMLHAADWHRSEEWVNEVAKDISRALTRLGYTNDS